MSHDSAQALQDHIHTKNNQGWRRIVLNFTPSWFAVTMGTGIASILLHNLPYNAIWLYWLSVIIFCLNVVLFISFFAISVVRYTMFPGIFTAMIQHPAQSLFMGTFPMGLATIINMIVFVCVPSWGQGAVILAWSLWWIDVAVALASCFYLPFIIIYVHKSDLSTMTAAWLLPIVATIVAAASGGIVAEVLPNPQHALWTIITSYVLWGTGFPMAMIVLTIYFHRLTVHHLPPREVIVSVFLPLGPLGQGSFALMQLGKVALRVFPPTNAFQMEDMGKIFYAVGHLASLIIWGFGLVWFFFALASVSRSKFPFNMGWWGFTFPIGVYAVATCTLAEHLPSAFFRNLGTIFSVAVVLLWAGIATETARRAYTGQIFFAPCVQGYERDVAAKMVEKRQGSVTAENPGSA